MYFKQQHDICLHMSNENILNFQQINISMDKFNSKQRLKLNINVPNFTSLQVKFNTKDIEISSLLKSSFQEKTSIRHPRSSCKVSVRDPRISESWLMSLNIIYRLATKEEKQKHYCGYTLPHSPVHHSQMASCVRTLTNLV